MEITLQTREEKYKLKSSQKVNTFKLRRDEQQDFDKFLADNKVSKSDAVRAGLKLVMKYYKNPALPLNK